MSIENPAHGNPSQEAGKKSSSPFSSLDPKEMQRILRSRDASEGDTGDLVAQMNDYLNMVDSIDVSLSVLAIIAERMAIKHGIVTPEEIANLRVGEK